MERQRHPVASWALCHSSLGVGPRIPGVRVPNRESHQRNPFYLRNFICIGLAASDPRLNKEPAVSVPTGSAQPRPRPHYSIGLAVALAPGSVANGLPGPHFFPSGKWQNIPWPPSAFPGELRKSVGWREGVGLRASPLSRSIPWTQRLDSGPIPTSQTQPLALVPCLEPQELLTSPLEYQENGAHPSPMPVFFGSYTLLLQSSRFLPSTPAHCAVCQKMPAFLFKPGREQNEARVTPVSSERSSHLIPLWGPF